MEMGDELERAERSFYYFRLFFFPLLPAKDLKPFSLSRHTKLRNRGPPSVSPPFLSPNLPHTTSRARLPNALLT